MPYIPDFPSDDADDGDGDDGRDPNPRGIIDRIIGGGDVPVATGPAPG